MKIFINTNDWTISKIENETPIVTGDNYVDTINVYYNNDPAYLNIIPTLNLLKPNNRKVGSIPFDIGTIENPNPSSYTDEDSNTWYRFVFTLSSDNGQIDEKGKYQCTIVTNYLDTSGNITAQRNVNVQFNVLNAVKNENSNIFILSESNPDQVIADVYQLVQTLSTAVMTLGTSKVDKANIGYIEITYDGPIVQTITGTLTGAQLAEASKKYCILRLKSDIYGDNVPFINLFYKYAITSGAYFFRTIPDVSSNQDASAFNSSNVLVFSNGDYRISTSETLFYGKTKADALLAAKVDKTQKINGYALSGDVTLDKSDVGLGNVDNTSDANKPISNATQSALDQTVKYDDVVDGLTNTSTNKPLSANQGKQLKAMIDAINILLASDNVDLDTIQEIVNYIENNKDLIDGITVTKINYTDIVDNLTSAIADKPLSAKQGYILKGFIDTLTDVETGIQANETVRILNESTRQSNEAARVAAEQERQTGYSGFDTRITANETAISGIKNGTNIDSFADVESALATKANTSDVYAKSEVYTKSETEALQSATLDASKIYCDESISNLQWQMGTYDLGVDTDTDVARLKTLHANTIKSMVDYIGGKTVKYNQLVVNSNFTTIQTVQGGDDYAIVSVSNNILSFTLKNNQSTVKFNSNYRMNMNSANIDASHKYFYNLKIKTPHQLNLLLSNGDIGVITTLNQWVDAQFIFTNISHTRVDLYFGNLLSSYGWEVNDVIQCQAFEVIDLTDKFGAGNEPSDVATAIPLLKANGYKLDGTDEYSTGSLKHAVVSGVKYGSKNLANPSLFELGSISVAPETKGQDVERNDRTRSNYIEVKPSTTYTVKWDGADVNYFLYDENKVFISNAIGGTFTTTATTKYVRFYAGISENPQILFNEGTNTTYIPYSVITLPIPSQVLADARYGLGYDNTNYNHLDSDGHLRGKRNTYTFTGNETLLDRGTNQLGLQIYGCDVASFMNYEIPVSNITTIDNYLGTTTGVGLIQDGSDTKGFRLYENASQPNARFIYFIGYTLAEIVGVTIEYNQATSFDQDYSQYFDNDWNKVDLDKQYATCEMVVAEPIDMPNSITNLIKEVKA